MLSQDNLEKIGYNFVLNRLDILTPFGNELRKNVTIFKINEREELINEYNKIDVIKKILKTQSSKIEDIKHILIKFKDIRRILKNIKNENYILDEVELFEIKNFSIDCENLRNTTIKILDEFKDLQLNNIDHVIKILNPEDIILGNFHIYENYSENLKKIRQEKLEIENQIYKVDSENEIKKLKENRVILIAKENSEEEIVKRELTKKLYTYIEDIKTNIDVIGRIDFILSKAELSEKYNAVRPDISKENEIILEKIKNPKLQKILLQKGKKIVSISIHLKSGTTIITGANMGGKSVSLYSITLNILLGLSGFFVFAKRAIIPMLDFVFFMTDDMKSIQKGLSTFGAEVVHFNKLVKLIEDKVGFAAIDEFARGTNPEEGRALLSSILKHFSRYNSFSLFTTHYDGVISEKMSHYQVCGLRNANFESFESSIDYSKVSSFDVIQEYMDYSLGKVDWNTSLPKDAIKIAKLLGMSSEILEYAKKDYKKSKN